jgi:hypothetical protein
MASNADGKPVEWVRDLVALRVIERNGPEGACGWCATLVEVQRVLVCAVKRLAILVRQIDGLDCILGEVRAKAVLCDNGAL